MGQSKLLPLVDRVPKIKELQENNVRKGFFEHSAFSTLKGELPGYLKGFVSFAYSYGWRLEEIAGLTWNQIDRGQGIVRLEVMETKNDAGKTVYLNDTLKEIFCQQFLNRHLGCQYVFHYNSAKIGNFRRAWNSACRKLGLGFGYKITRNYVAMWEHKFAPSPTLHDFRRTAVRNMVRAGIPEKVVMTLSGHKTRCVFDHYNIVNDQDLRRAAEQQASYLQSLHGHNLGSICQKGSSMESSNSV